MLNTSEVVRGLIALENAIERSGLDNGLLVLARLSIPQINSCAFFIQMQVKDALELAEVLIRSRAVFAGRAWRSKARHLPVAYTTVPMATQKLLTAWRFRENPRRA